MLSPQARLVRFEDQNNFWWHFLEGEEELLSVWVLSCPTHAYSGETLFEYSINPRVIIAIPLICVTRVLE